MGEYKTVFNLHKCDIDFFKLVFDTLEYISNKILDPNSYFSAVESNMKEINAIYIIEIHHNHPTFSSNSHLTKPREVGKVPQISSMRILMIGGHPKV